MSGLIVSIHVYRLEEHPFHFKPSDLEIPALRNSRAGALATFPLPPSGFPGFSRFSRPAGERTIQTRPLAVNCEITIDL